jgi:hypothetical protein
VIESYQSLQEDYTKTSVDLLRQISHQLANPSLPAAPDSSQFQVQRSDVQVNVCWFVSLVLSLVVALFGIFFKQWMRSYMTWTDVTPYRDAVAIRHFRYRTLEIWHIETILELLPTLLQLSVVIFLGGLFLFLWGSIPSLTIVMAAFCSIACFFVVAATFLPGFSQLCPYRSSLSRFAALPIRYVLDRVTLAVKSALKSFLQSATQTFIRSRHRLFPWAQLLLRRQHAMQSDDRSIQSAGQSTQSADQSVTTLSTSWLDVDKGVLDRRANENHISMSVGAMVHLCSTTQSPHLREAVITAIMSQYPADGPMEYPEPMMSRIDEAYCKEVWWPIIGHIVQLYEEQIGDGAILIFNGPSLLLWTVNSQFIRLPLSMQRRWLSFLSSLEGLVCRSHSEHMIKAYLVCCTASVSSQSLMEATDVCWHL